MLKQQLWKAIGSLYDMLADKINEEHKYQQFFVDHPIAFSVLGYDVAIPFDKSSNHSLPFDPERNYRPEPDFLCATRRDQVLTIFELKTPFASSDIVSRVDGNRTKFRSTLETHLSQAYEYVESIRERESARNVVCQALVLDGISSYKVRLVHGLTNEIEAAQTSRLLARRVPTTEILAYDELLDLMARQYLSGRANIENGQGWCLIAHLTIPAEQNRTPAYIVDIGEIEKNRASVYLIDGMLTFSVLTADGQSLQSTRHRFHSDRPIFIRIEFMLGDSGLNLSCFIDDIEVDFRESTSPIQIDLSLRNLHVGSDLWGRNRGKFRLLEHYIVGRTLNLSERIETYRYFKARSQKYGGCLEFDGTKAMRRSADGSLCALDDDSRPIYRDRLL